MEVMQNFKFRSRDPDHAHIRGYFVICWKILIMVNTNTKYEVFTLNRSIDIEGVPKSPHILTKFALRMRGVT